jgi:NAD(P)-dependent dehydrogenase (short-subunit alcohol dehydrogenase family)
VKALVAAGWRVYATALPGQDTTDLAGEDIEVVEVDLTDEQSTAELLKAVTREDRLDAFVSNAGIVAPGPVIERDVSCLTELGPGARR